MKTLRVGIILCILIAAVVLLAGCPTSTQTTRITTTPTTTELVPTKKPAIYLYPLESMAVRVTLKYAGQLTCTYPEYRDGWQVIAHPDGTLINQADGREYSYLYWEGIAGETYDFSRGFVVRGQDTRQFLQEKLAYLGLTPREYNEFIVYWLPQMQNNPYNLIAFQGEAYTRLAGLEITPAPDSLLRIFMAYRPLQQPISIEDQVLSPGIRKGFTVVEWGGSCVPGGD
jgi:hypothetical protein